MLFRNPAHQTNSLKEVALYVHRWETINSKLPGPILMIGQSRIGNRQSHHIYCTPLWQVHSVCCAIQQPQQTEHICMSKTDFPPELNRHVLTFLHLISMSRVTYRAPVGMLVDKGKARQSMYIAAEETDEMPMQFNHAT